MGDREMSHGGVEQSIPLAFDLDETFSPEGELLDDLRKLGGIATLTDLREGSGPNPYLGLCARSVNWVLVNGISIAIGGPARLTPNKRRAHAGALGELADRYGATPFEALPAAVQSRMVRDFGLERSKDVWNQIAHAAVLIQEHYADAAVTECPALRQDLNPVLEALDGLGGVATLDELAAELGRQSIEFGECSDMEVRRIASVDIAVGGVRIRPEEWDRYFSGSNYLTARFSPDSPIGLVRSAARSTHLKRLAVDRIDELWRSIARRQIASGDEGRAIPRALDRLHGISIERELAKVLDSPVDRKAARSYVSWRQINGVFVVVGGTELSHPQTRQARLRAFATVAAAHGRSGFNRLDAHSMAPLLAFTTRTRLKDMLGQVSPYTATSEARSGSGVSKQSAPTATGASDAGSQIGGSSRSRAKNSRPRTIIELLDELSGIATADELRPKLPPYTPLGWDNDQVTRTRIGGAQVAAGGSGSSSRAEREALLASLRNVRETSELKGVPDHRVQQLRRLLKLI